MGFTLEAQEQKLQERGIQGKRYKAAVSCWFTSKGKIIPRLLKYEDERGERHIVESISLESSSQKYYAGILLHRFDCRTVIDNVEYRFVLLYHPKENIWEMLLPDK